MNDDRLVKYSVGPLPNETWLTLYHAISMAIRYEEEGDDLFTEEFLDAKQDFLNAHPDASLGSVEDWPESMQEAWNETIKRELDQM